MISSLLSVNFVWFTYLTKLINNKTPQHLSNLSCYQNKTKFSHNNNKPEVSQGYFCSVLLDLNLKALVLEITRAESLNCVQCKHTLLPRASNYS